MKRKQLNIQDFAIAKKSFVVTPRNLKLAEDKKYAKTLSTHKLVHARDEDPEDTMIIKSLYPDSPATLRRYGIKGIENIKHFYFSMLKLLSIVGEEELQQKCRYVTKLQIDAIFKTIGECEDEIEGVDMDINETIIKQLDYVFAKLSNEDSIGITMSSNSPMMCCFNFRDGERKSGIFLFISEVFKLLKYINARFSFVNISNNQVNDDVDLEKDNFF